ncbi:MAG: hypothetical protein ACJ746_20735 [Bryobacteraceae bacterium]
MRKKDCYLTALFRRVSVNGGRKKAALAVAHRMLIIAWHIIQDGTVYEELGGNHYDRLHPDRSVRRLIKRLEQIGFQVTVKQAMPETGPTPKDASSAQKQAACNHRPSVQTKPAPVDAPPQRPAPKAADPTLCRRCARWGIPCIHGRNAKRSPSANAPSNLSGT